RNLKVYDVDSGKEIGSFDGGISPDGSLSGDGRRLLATSDYRSELHVWDVKAGGGIARLRFPESLTGKRGEGWRFSVSCPWAAFIGPTDSVYVFRIPLELKPKEMPKLTMAEKANTIEPLYRVRGFRPGWDGAIQPGWFGISPDGKHFLAVRGHHRDRHVHVFTQSGKLLWEKPGVVACFTPDGTQVITMASGSIRHVRVFEVATGKQLREFDTGDHLYNMHLVGRGTRLLLATERSTQVWDWSIPKKLYD